MLTADPDIAVRLAAFAVDARVAGRENPRSAKEPLVAKMDQSHLEKFGILTKS